MELIVQSWDVTRAVVEDISKFQQVPVLLVGLTRPVYNCTIHASPQSRGTGHFQACITHIIIQAVHGRRRARQ